MSESFKTPTEVTPEIQADLVMLVRRLCRALQVVAPDHVLPPKAIDYLNRKNLIDPNAILR